MALETRVEAAVVNFYTGGRRPMSANTTARINPTTNSAHAMFTAVPAIPVKPNTPATMAMIRNVAAHPIIMVLLD